MILLLSPPRSHPKHPTCAFSMLPLCLPSPAKENRPTPAQEQPSARKRKRCKVHFDAVHVRRYHLTLGDNPSVREGIPLTLEWAYFETQSFNIEEYEEQHRRSSPTFSGKSRAEVMSVEQREALVYDQQGLDPEQVKEVISEIQTVKISRTLERLAFHRFADGPCPMFASERVAV